MARIICEIDTLCMSVYTVLIGKTKNKTEDRARPRQLNNMKILTLNKKITNRQRQSFWLALILFNFCVQSLQLINPALVGFTSLDFFFALNLLAPAICLWKGVYEKKPVYLLGLSFIAWYTVCFFVKTEVSSFRETGMFTVALLFSAWGLALPFVTVTDDFDKKRALNIILSVLTVILAIVVWAALIPTFMRTSFSLLGSDMIFGILETTHEQSVVVVYKYPVVFGMHYYYTAYLSVLGFFMALYLFAQKKMRPLMTVGMIGFVLAISLTKCRQALLGFGLGLFTLGFFLFRNKNRDASPKKTILAGVVIALTVALGLTLMWQLGTLASKYILAEGQNDYMDRGFSEQLLNGSGRLELWAKIPDMLKGYAPSGFFFGIREDVFYPLIYNSLNMCHIHSGYFSALVLMGIPGFLMSLVFLFKTVKDMLYIFLKMKTHIISRDNLLLFSIPVCFLLAAVGEPILFVGYNFRMITLVCYLVSGYVFELADRIRKDDLSLHSSNAEFHAFL